jgi:7-alpha-hydroxysteroid dehydrogenase
VETILDRFRLDGQAILITGGGTGLGEGMAAAFAEAGARVAIVGRRAEKLEAVCAAIAERGGAAIAIQGDLTQRGEGERIAATAAEKLGGLTALVNNIGGSPDRPTLPVLDVSEESWAAHLDQNLTSCWRMTKAAVPLMGEGSSIVNVSSVRGLTRHGGPSGAYGVAKAGVNSLTWDLAVDLAPKIRVNGIAPGPVPTEGFLRARGLGSAEEAHRVAPQYNVPLGRFGTPEDIAALAIYLISPAASWITGQMIVASGGL